MVTYDAARAPSSMFTELADQSKELHCVMHYVMHCVMHYVMHCVIHYIMHHVMHYVLHLDQPEQSRGVPRDCSGAATRPLAYDTPYTVVRFTLLCTHDAACMPHLTWRSAWCSA